MDAQYVTQGAKSTWASSSARRVGSMETAAGLPPDVVGYTRSRLGGGEGERRKIATFIAGRRLRRDAKRLSATFVNTVNVPGRYGDGRGGHGLSLLVKPASTGGFSKSWAQRIRLHGKAANVGLGAYPVVTLARARQKALANARIASEGRDPRERASRAPTFEQAVEKVIGIHAENWKGGGKSAAQCRASLRDYAVPKIGAKRVDRISTGDVMEVLLPIWSTKTRNRAAGPAAHRRGHEVGRRAGLPRG